MGNGRGMTEPLIFIADDSHIEFYLTILEGNLTRIDKIFIVSNNGKNFKLLSEFNKEAKITPIKPLYDALQNEEIYIGIPIHLFRKTEEEDKYSKREDRFLQDVKLTDLGYQVFYNVVIRGDNNEK